ncbi:MAG: glycosyltransferase family 2 protein [Armatimonadota bacterium]|nr:glycosyltransferase family 2 protein [bacterium]
MRLSIIIPCYNEAEHIAQVIKAVSDVDLHGIEKEIIIVDDGSTDDTIRVINEHNADKRITLHISNENVGKGAAIRAGLNYVTGDIVIIQDADLEYDPEQYLEIITPIVEGNADVVYGSRFLGKIEGMRIQNRLANYILTFTTNLLFGMHITDEATCYKAFKSDVLKQMPLKCCGFEFCPEVTAKLAKHHIDIYEVPIHYTGRNKKEGKKIRLSDAFVAVWTLFKYRFVN